MFQDITMETKNHRVDYLKKITVSLEMGTSEKDMDLSPAPSEFQFIYNVGAQGICLFEKALFGKHLGETIVLKVNNSNLKELFGHLLPKLSSILPQKSDYFLKSSIVSVDLAENREVVQAIADGTGSCSCDCGCGCT